jgi:hypothetical protein
MYALDLVHILASSHHVEVKLVPERHSSQAWSRKLRNGREVESPECAVQDGQDENDSEGEDDACRQTHGSNGSTMKFWGE